MQYLASKPEEIDHFAEGITPLLDKVNGVYHYQSAPPVGVVIWRRP